MTNKSPIKAVGIAAGLSFVPASFATVVDIETTQGTIQVNLFDQSTPKTVANFLTYVNEQSYVDTVIHRSVEDFVVQGGGFTFDGETLQPIDVNGTVDNEPEWSNIEGTIAMAKVAGDPDSATSQWFFNVGNNSANLDLQNEGFTVFGQVVSGMDVVEQINQLETCGDVPMVDFSDSDCTSNVTPTDENLVKIISITVSDSSTDTEDSVDKVPNIFEPITPTPDPGGDDSSSGGSMPLMLIGLLGLMRLFRK